MVWKGRVGKLEGRDPRVQSNIQLSGWEEECVEGGHNTSHVFLALKHYKGVATMRLLFFVALLVGMRIPDDPDLLQELVTGQRCNLEVPYTLNGPEATKFPLKVVFIGVVAKARDNQSLEGVTSDIRIFTRFV